MSRRRPNTAAVCATVLVSLLAAACSSAGDYETTTVPGPSETPSASSAPAPAPAPPPNADITTANCLQSYAPTNAQPAPGRMPGGSYMSKIQRRGRLIAGVSADTLLLGARNPISGKIEGFDIDLLHAISQAIFGNPDRIELRVITAADRLPVLQDGTVDIVARNMTINCTRWKDIAFSSEYYRSGQKVLVRLGETADGGRPVTRMQDLEGKKVCAPNGSTSMEKLRTFDGLEPVGADAHTGCLVRFQEGSVDAITGDDTVLAGLAAQDPYAEVVDAPAFTAEPYGLGVHKRNVDFVRFINGVLEDLRSNGQWTRNYNTWLAEALGQAPTPPKPVYGRTR